MKNVAYQKFVRRWEEVTDLPPQTVGPLTPMYKAAVKRLKVMPWPLIAFGSIVFVIALYIVIGSTVTLIVSTLQRGF